MIQGDNPNDYELNPCNGGRKGLKIMSEESEAGERQLEDKIAEVMKHSGVSITITSLTDFIAFAIGGTTSIPALKSFCMFCGMGIISVYVFQATW